MKLRADVAMAMRPLMGVGMPYAEFNQMCEDVRGMLDAGLWGEVNLHVQTTLNCLLVEQRAKALEGLGSDADA